MGKCLYCGESAGLFKKVHHQCEEAHGDGIRQIVDLARSAVGATPGSQIGGKIRQVAQGSRLLEAELQRAVADGWEAALNDALDDHLVSAQEEQQLLDAIPGLPVTKDQLQELGPFVRLVSALALRDIDEGKIPDRISLHGSLPFNFQKQEQLVWVFQNVDLYEERTKTQFVGGSRGVSVRVARGVYYRVGAFQGERISETHTVHTGTGILAATTKHLYFAGAKPFRVPYAKIVTITPFPDGFGIQRDAASAKPQTFLTGDGWFATNLVSKLAALA